MQVITDTDDLASFCATLRQGTYFAVDTEFMREKTYWPMLCLIQAAGDGCEAIIDPLAEGIDLGPFLALMTDPDIVKVFHAARQDAEIFHLLCGRPPTPLFDSQIAAMACGFGDQIGYEPLMRRLLGARIDKGSRFTDWSRRPLSTKQLEYALSDVTHLRAAYPLLVGRLEDGGRSEWVAEEMAALADPALYNADPEQAWKRLKLRGVKPRELAILQITAAWREREAQTRDVPRGRVMKDDALFEIARNPPKSAEDMARHRALPNGFERSKPAQRLVEVVTQALEIPKEDLPQVRRAADREPAPPEVVELLRVLLKRQCETHNVAPKLIANSADLDEIARNDDADVPALKGWRRRVFGEAALKLKSGKIAMKLENGAVKLVETP